MSATDILEACLARMETLGISPALPIAWPGIVFTPPGTGMWLEAKLFPNEPRDLAWDADGCALQRGFLQVMVGYRPGGGQVNASQVADAVIAHFPKATELGPVRVSKRPYQTPPLTEADKLYIAVTIPYSGITD